MYKIVIHILTFEYTNYIKIHILLSPLNNIKIGVHNIHSPLRRRCAGDVRQGTIMKLRIM